MDRRKYWSKKLKLPYYPNKKNDGKENPYIIATVEEKTIADYLHIPLLEVDNLNIVEYLFFLREAFIYNCSQAEEGIEYLINAKRLETTEPERKKLRKKIEEQQTTKWVALFFVIRREVY